MIGKLNYLSGLLARTWHYRKMFLFQRYTLTMVKIFIGNLPDGGLVKNEDVRPLFEAYGTVTECEVIKNYGWVILRCRGLI